jgi:hypothetical protein
MIESPTQCASANETEVFSFVSESLSSHPPIHKQLVGLNRKLHDYHSSFAIEELTAEFEDGDRLAILFKNLSPEGLLPGARQTRPHFYYHPEREITVYHEILAPADLGTATYYGSVVDADRQRYWLLLEKVAGEELYQIGDIEIWCDVARWLAEMHRCLGKYAKARPTEANLTTYDDHFCNLWIERAELFHRRGNAATAIGSSQMNWLIDQCRWAVRHMCSLPPTLIHGEFYASNILIARRHDQTRICPVDWETAAIGPPLIDVAALIAGRWTEPHKHLLAQAYFDALPPLGRCWSNIEEMTLSLQCCRLFQAIRWLGWSADWEPPSDHRFDWLAEAIHMAESINSRLE